MRRSPFAVAVTLLAACAQPPDPHRDGLLAVLWMQHAIEYRVACQQAFATARAVLPAAIADRSSTALAQQGAGVAALPPAIITDLDETILDNSAFAARRIRDGEAATSWTAWVNERKATAICGAVEFLQFAQQQGARVIYVTNRDHDKEEAATRDNLRALGCPLVEDAGEDLVLCRGEIGDKEARRQHVAKRYRVVMLLGDNAADFVGGVDAPKDGPDRAGRCREVESQRGELIAALGDRWGRQWIVLPNPVYGSWLDLLRGQGDDLRTLLHCADAVDSTGARR